MHAGETTGPGGATTGPGGATTGPGGASSPEPRGRSAIYSVELEVFEGPLDLLLHLVRRHELEILDIPIAFITEKYLEYLDLMRSLDLEIAGDYLVMAATLAWLKSRELLPSDRSPGEAAAEDDEDGEDPREALIRRLVEYERFKNAAADLDALPMSGRDVFARGADIDVPAIDPGLAPVTLFKLAEAYYRVLTRAKVGKSHEVQLEPVTVAQRMTQLTLLLDRQESFDFEGLFLGRTWASEKELRTLLVVTLMSVLELVKLGVARVQQVTDSESIRIYRHVVTDETRALIDAYDEDQSYGDAGQPPKPAPPPPTEAELDAAEELVLLAEALAGADDTDLGPHAGAAPAANTGSRSDEHTATDDAPADASFGDARTATDDEYAEASPDDEHTAKGDEHTDVTPGDEHTATDDVSLSDDERTADVADASPDDDHTATDDASPSDDERTADVADASPDDEHTATDEHPAASPDDEHTATDDEHTATDDASPSDDERTADVADASPDDEHTATDEHPAAPAALLVLDTHVAEDATVVDPDEPALADPPSRAVDLDTPEDPVQPRPEAPQASPSDPHANEPAVSDPPAPSGQEDDA